MPVMPFFFRRFWHPEVWEAHWLALRVGVGLLAGALLAVGLAGCPGSSGASVSASGKTVTVGGRVVDLESCYQSCRGVSGVRVSLFFDSSFVSEKTGVDGAFTLSAVPDGVRLYLLVTDDEQQAYLSTLQAEPVTTRGSDISTMELYALRADGPIYRAITSDLGTTVRERALYLGQVLCVQGGKPGAQDGASATLVPEASVRYVKDAEGISEVFYPTTFNATGPFGVFVAIGPASTEPIDHAIVIHHPSRQFQPLFVPLARGFVAVGTHRSRPTEAGVGCNADGGL